MLNLSNDFNMPEGYKSNGCGSDGNSNIVPNTIYGLSVFEACRLHDYAYLKGKTNEDKDKADREFLNNLIRIITNYDKWWYPTSFAKVRAKEYYLAVKYFGGSAFFDKG